MAQSGPAIQNIWIPVERVNHTAPAAVPLCIHQIKKTNKPKKKQTKWKYLICKVYIMKCNLIVFNSICISYRKFPFKKKECSSLMLVFHTDMFFQLYIYVIRSTAMTQVVLPFMAPSPFSKKHLESLGKKKRFIHWNQLLFFIFFFCCMCVWQPTRICPVSSGLSDY